MAVAAAMAVDSGANGAGAAVDHASVLDTSKATVPQTDALTSTTAATTDTVTTVTTTTSAPISTTPATSWTDTSTRERIAGSPLVPDCVKWADDGRVAVVSDASIMISTFMSRELEMYMQQGPAISKSYIFLPSDTSHEHLPISIPVFNEPTDSAVSPGSMTNFLLYEADRHQHNPKELSLSKSEGRAFLSATWGPRGSGPNASCALLTLTCSSRIALYFASSFRMNWHEVAVLSETLYAFFDKADFKMQRKRSNSSVTEPAPAPTSAATPRDAPTKVSKKRRRTNGTDTGAEALSASVSEPPQQQLPSPLVPQVTSSVTDYAHKCELLATLSIAWSPFVLASDNVTTTSLIALCGRKVATIWGYASPSFATGSESGVSESYLSPAPVAWIATEKFGWVTTTAWQQSHYELSTAVETLTLVMGTTAGNVLLARVPILSDPVRSGGFPSEVVVHRTVMAPHCQPVFNVCLGSLGDASCTDLVVASGSTISVWNLHDTQQQPQSPSQCWRAHAGNVTGLGVSYFGDTIFSCGVDGALRAWDKHRGLELPFRSTSSGNGAGSADASKYPLFGLAVSPSSAQLACVHIIPPAARPNRKSQADVSYSRVSSALEYVAPPSASDPAGFVDAVCRVLDASCNVSAFTDVLWFCHEDNSALTSLHGSADLTIPHLLDKLRGVSRSRESERSRQPLYLSLCDTLEHKYAETTAAARTTTGTTLSLSTSQWVSAIRYLQASYLLRSCIPPAENHIAIRDAALVSLRRTLLGYWAERCLTELVSTHSHVENFAGISTAERISALLMADFLSVQTPLSEPREQLVTSVYTRLGSDDNIARWLAHLQRRVEHRAGAHDKATPTADSEKVDTVAPTPPPRQTCFICDQPVPFDEFELVCASGHAQERCFLSFQVLASLDAWRCMGCGASACEIDLSSGSSPFYLLESQLRSLAPASSSSGGGAKIACRLCGNFCSFFSY